MHLANLKKLSNIITDILFQQTKDFYEKTIFNAQLYACNSKLQHNSYLC